MQNYPYDLQYRQGTSGNFTTGPQNVTGTSASIGSLTPNTSYEVQVRATNAEGDGDWSFSGTGTTGASVPPGGGGSPVTGYEYRHAAGDGVPEDTPWQSAGLGLERTVAGLTNGQQYAFEVRAVNGAGPGAAATTVATPLGVPSVPESLVATAGDGEVFLEWTAPADDGDSPVTGYDYRHAAGDGVPEDTPWQSAGLSLERTVAGLTNGQPYVFEVRALNGAGLGAAARAVATPLGMPSVPESLTATAGDGEVFLEWTAPADDGGSPVTGYEYRYAADDGVPDGTLWQDAGTELSTTVTGLENETPYGFEVRALNSAGPGAAAMTTATPVRLEAELFSSAAAEGEALVIGVRRSGGLAFPAHAYIGVTDSAVPEVTATEEGRDDGLGRHRLEFAAGAAEATVTVTVAFDGERRQDRVLTATLDSAELEVDGVRRPYELVTPTLVVPVTEGDAGLSVADARVQGKSSVLAFTVSLDRTRDVAVRVDYATEDGSARAGEDYTPVSGTLVIAAGGREGTVEVPVLPALHLAGERTLTLRLSNAVSSVIDDGVATGTIVRESELPKAWLARFGRTASDAPFGGVDADPGTPGLRAGTWGGAPGALDRESSADAGQTLRRAVLPDFGFRLPGAEEALLGTSFYVERGAQQDVGGGTWAAWGDDREHAHECASVHAGPARGEGRAVGRGGLGPWRTRDHAGERGHARGGSHEQDGGARCPGGAHGCRWARDRAAFRPAMDGDGLGRDRRAGGGGGHGEPRAPDARGRGPDPRARRRRASQGRGRCALRRRGRGDRTGIRGGRRTRLGSGIADASVEREDARRPR